MLYRMFFNWLIPGCISPPPSMALIGQSSCSALFLTVYNPLIPDPHFSIEDGGSMFLRNVGIRAEDYTTQHPRRSVRTYIAVKLQIL
jgi:hypothetical protein